MEKTSWMMSLSEENRKRNNTSLFLLLFNKRTGAVLSDVNPAQRRRQVVGRQVRHSVGMLELVKVKTLLQIKAVAEQRVYLRPAASFSIVALRSSAFCCERRKTFLSSWRWSSVPTSSPFTVFIWLSSICVWWREFLLYRLLERTFSSKSSASKATRKHSHTHTTQLPTGALKTLSCNV